MMTHPALRPFRLLLCAVLISFCALTQVQAADRARLEAFLSVTGFDVALESIRLSAEAAPEMIGLDADDFGSAWVRLTEEIFETGTMHAMALDILELALDDETLAHAAAFYASDLGQRLVAAENAAHMMEDDTVKRDEGAALVADMMETGAERLKTIERMNRAIDSSGTSVRALQEIQMRFMLAAGAAGVIELQVDAETLRKVMRAQEPQLRAAIQRSALTGAAWTYRDFSDADLEAYAEALEQPLMQRVYELMNAVQYEVMANRFEVLARRMAALRPEQDI